MKKIRRALLTIFVLTILSACSGSNTPAEVVEQFYRHMSAGEVSQAYQLFTTDTRKMAEEFGGLSVLAGKSEKIQKKGGITEIKVVKEETTGELAVVEMEVTYGNGEKSVHEDKLVKVDGEWKMTANK